MDSIEQLLTGNWEIQNKKRLARMITEHAHAGNYAVFDWDFTCIFFDIQYSFFIHQIECLYFKLEPKAFSAAIRAHIPQDIPLKHTSIADNTGKETKIITAGDISEDLDARYRFLYDAYEGLNGNVSLEQVCKTDEYLDFKAKLLLLGNCAERIAPVDISQSLTAGMTLKELTDFTEKTIDAALQEPIKHYEIHSPAALAGKAGVIKTMYTKGIRIQPEMQQLIHLLQQYGIAVYVCSASQEAVVRVFACHPMYGYNIQPEHVFGRRQKRDEQERITVEIDDSIPRTLGKGKAAAIQECIAPKHGNKPPVLIAGDSDGDFYMMQAFKDSSLLLILNRHPSEKALMYPLIQTGLADRDNPDASIIVQHRDYANGTFIRAEGLIPRRLRRNEGY